MFHSLGGWVYTDAFCLYSTEVYIQAPYAGQDRVHLSTDGFPPPSRSYVAHMLLYTNAFYRLNLAVYL